MVRDAIFTTDCLKYAYLTLPGSLYMSSHSAQTLLYTTNEETIQYSYKQHRTENHAVTGKPCNAAVNFDTVLVTIDIAAASVA